MHIVQTVVVGARRIVAVTVAARGPASACSPLSTFSRTIPEEWGVTICIDLGIHMALKHLLPFSEYLSPVETIAFFSRLQASLAGGDGYFDLICSIQQYP